MQRTIRPILLSGLAALAVWACGCGGPDVRPQLEDPAYKARLVFSDGFDQGLAQWIPAGLGRVTVNSDTALEMASVSDTAGAAVWSRVELPENFQIEYEVFLPDTHGTHAVYFCAAAADGRALDGQAFPSSGGFNAFMRTGLLSYQILVHTYEAGGGATSGTRLRKNPGNLLLSGSPVDPCRENRRYLIDVFKAGNRIRFFVDGVSVHDVRDRGGFGPVYERGRFGFHLQGRAGAFRTVLDDVRVFTLIPR